MRSCGLASFEDVSARIVSVGSALKSERIRIDGSMIKTFGVDVASIFGNAASRELLTTREPTCVKHAVEMQRPISKRSHHACLQFFFIIVF